MADEFNNIFSRLVEHEDDFVGMVAYTIYKRQKVEWIKRHHEQSGSAPSAGQLDAGFLSVTCLESQLSIYRDQALDLLDHFLDIVLAEQLDEIHEEVRNDAIVKSIKRSFWSDVGANVVAGLCASLITLGAAGLTWVAFKGPENIVRDVLRDHIEPAASQPPAIAPPAPN